LLATSFVGVEAAGFLNLSFRVVDMFWAIAATAVAQVALPLMARLQSDPARLKRAYQASTRFSCLALYPCFVGLGSVAPDVIEMLFGHRWQPSSPYVTVLGFLVLLQAPRLVLPQLLTAIGKPQDALVGLLAELTFMLIAVWLSSVPTLPWAISIWAGSECVLLVVSCWVLRRAAGYSAFDQFAGVLNPLLAALFMAAVVFAARTRLSDNIDAVLRLAILVPLGAMAYAGSIFLIDRKLVKDFWVFGRTAFDRSSKHLELF
jgi:polysaccharide transporter, PST family